MANKKPIDPQKPLKRSAKVARDTVIDAELLPTEPSRGPLQKTLYALQIQGILSLVSGGILAGTIGFFAAILFESLNANDPLAPLLNAQSELYEKLEVQSAQIETIKARPVWPDLSGTLSTLGLSIKRLKTDIKALSAAHAEQAKILAQRIDVLENIPLPGGVSSKTMAAYEHELAQLRTDVGRMASYAATRVERAKDTTEVLRTKNVTLSSNGAVLTALNDIWVAVESGVGFGGPLAELVAATDLDVAPILAENASMGVVSLVFLQGQFPTAARAALKLVRQENGSQQGESRILTFLKTQLGFRSLRAKDGASADAILSRALVAIDRGDIELALSEIVSLPNSSKAALQDWSNAAGQRLRVLTALQNLATMLTDN